MAEPSLLAIIQHRILSSLRLTLVDMGYDGDRLRQMQHILRQDAELLAAKKLVAAARRKEC